MYERIIQFDNANAAAVAAAECGTFYPISHVREKELDITAHKRSASLYNRLTVLPNYPSLS